jgi:hypothetical protein
LETARHAVLSHASRQHRQDLCFAYPPAFDQADHDQQVTPHDGVDRLCLAAPGSAIGSTRWGMQRPQKATSLIVLTFFLFPFRAAVIRSAPPVGTLPSMHPPTTEGAGQIAPSGITRVSQKENMAVSASAKAASQRRVLS